MSSNSHITIQPITGLPELEQGDDLAKLIVTQNDGLTDNDILVISQKAVSKVEGCVVDLRDIAPSKEAFTLAQEHQKDPRLVEVILRETREIVRARHGVLICRTHHGFVCANAGVDRSNVAGDYAVLLPKNPDVSAWNIKDRIAELTGKHVGIIIADSFGRPWRNGQCDIAIGAAGVKVLNDLRGTTDRFGNTLAATEIAIADQLAAAADLARHKTSGEPVVLIRGCKEYVEHQPGINAQALLRSRSADLFL